MRQMEAIECMYAACNLKYCSEFHILLQAVVYAITQSKTTVEIIGHLGPGASYSLVKEWLAGLGGTPLQIPDGFVTVGFDNEQRQLKSYLARGPNRSSFEVLTNVVYALHSAEEHQNKDAFHFRHWKFPSAEEIIQTMDSAPKSPLESESTLFPYLLSYIEGRICGLLNERSQAADPVEAYQSAIENAQRYLVCPKCATQVEKRLHLCPNENCRVNVRQAIQTASGQSRVSTECIRIPKVPRQSGAEFVYSAGVGSEGVSMSRTRETPLTASLPPVTPATIGLLDPVFVNPNSYEAVKVLLRELGTCAGVKQCVGSDGQRHWLSVVCDGLPYSLMRNIMHQACESARKQAYHEAGIYDVHSMQRDALKDVCKDRGLSTQGTVAVLKERVASVVKADLESGKLTAPASIPSGEFDWVVCTSGGLHWEMNVIQCIVKSLWPFVYKEFCVSQGYTTPKQLEWAMRAKDHHRCYDELSRFTDGCFDELLRPYVLSSDLNTPPTASGFLDWAKKLENNATYSWLLELVIQYCISLFMMRRGMRHNDIPLYLESRRHVAPLLYARNHSTYQLIDMV
eukprot:scpid36361/ scgid7600/ 